MRCPECNAIIADGEVNCPDCGFILLSDTDVSRKVGALITWLQASSYRLWTHLKKP